jgi:prepilin-type N-terminal cleavage/methylation domain-containing protein
MLRRATTDRRTRARRPACAFTLVELLVAMTISSLLVVSVVSATRALSGSRRGVDRRMARATSGRHAMEAIVAALRNVRRDPIRDQPVVVGQRGGGGGAGGDRIDLQVTGDRRVRPDGPESDQYETSFFLARPAGHRLPVLLCRRDHGLDEHPEDGGIAMVVAEGIIGLSFAYYLDGQWSDEWSSAEPRAPAAVRVIVAAVGPAPDDASEPPSPLVLSTVVPIRVNPPTEERPQQQQRQQQPPPRPGSPPPGGPQR